MLQYLLYNVMQLSSQKGRLTVRNECSEDVNKYGPVPISNALMLLAFAACCLFQRLRLLLLPS